jgi:polar amino acid transport system substrate-binding protein
MPGKRCCTELSDAQTLQRLFPAEIAFKAPAAHRWLTRGESGMLSRRDFGAGFATAAAARRRGADHQAPTAPPANEPSLARILRTRKLRIGAATNEQPYFYKNSWAGHWSGFLVAMAGNLAAALGVDLAVIESNWPEAVTDLHTGKIDLGYVLNPTPQRAMFADFSTPLFHDTYAVVARKAFTPKTWFKTREEALLAVESGRADCFVATLLAALPIVKKNPQIGELIIPTPHLRVAVCAAVPYDNDRRFHGVANAWAEDVRDNGQIREWITVGLAEAGIAEGDLPADLRRINR